MKPSSPELSPIPQVLHGFGLTPDGARIVPFGTGNIHKTYFVESGEGQFLLQTLNTLVFPDVGCIEANMRHITAVVESALRERGEDPARRGITFVATAQNQLVLQADGRHWRLMRFIGSTYSRRQAETAAQAGAAAGAFAQFDLDLMRCDPSMICDTIPGFHDTPARVARLDQATGTSRREQTPELHRALSFLETRREPLDQFSALFTTGTLPRRVCHNDAKMDNLLLDEETGAPVCVVDLDTVMPGSPLYDLGDLLRSAGATVSEEEPDSSLVAVNRPHADAVLSGFLEVIGAHLSALERDKARFAGWHITMEQGVRFLTDYLLGDVYYPVRHARHNLDRAMNQFALAESLESWAGGMP